MIFNVPYDEINSIGVENYYNTLLEKIKSEATQPLHKTSLMEHKIKYLGYYIACIDVPFRSSYDFIAYDLYVYEGSKFTGRTYIAVYDDGDTQYLSESEDKLKDKSNKDLATTPTGEAYRRYNKRKPIIGSLTKLR